MNLIHGIQICKLIIYFVIYLFIYYFRPGAEKSRLSRTSSYPGISGKNGGPSIASRSSGYSHADDSVEEIEESVNDIEDRSEMFVRSQGDDSRIERGVVFDENDEGQQYDEDFVDSRDDDSVFSSNSNHVNKNTNNSYEDIEEEEDLTEPERPKIMSFAG